MVFVNTSLNVAKQRNKERARRLPEKILTKSWKDVQKNLGAFQSLFGSNFVIVDNSNFLEPEEAQKKFGKITKKYIDKFIKKPIKNEGFKEKVIIKEIPIEKIVEKEVIKEVPVEKIIEVEKKEPPKDYKVYKDKKPPKYKNPWGNPGGRTR